MNEQGKNGVRIFWYDEGKPAGQRFIAASDRTASDDVYQMSLGQALEDDGHSVEARSAYSKAVAKSLATASLERVSGRENEMPQFITWLSLVGSLCFGVVLGWVTSRTLRRVKLGGLSDIATILGIIGGAAVTALFRRETGDFGAYCIGLMIGFFLYLIIAIKMIPPEDRKSISDWLGSDPPPRPSNAADDPFGGSGPPVS